MRDWRSKKSENPAAESDHLELARESLRDLLADERVPGEVREALAEDYRQVEEMLGKLEHEEVHIAVFGRVSVGKSALLNALLGERRFSTSPLHGETRATQRGQWHEYRSGGVYLIDTPGINEIDGEARERLARETASRSDLVIFVVDGDITEVELSALKSLQREHRPLLLALNKSDRYTAAEREELLASLQRHTASLVEPGHLLAVSADPPERVVIRVAADGSETEARERREPDVGDLRDLLWRILEREGRTLAALNASLFAGDLTDSVGARVLAARRHLGTRVIRTYCIAKGVAVALNPVPVTDLVAAVAVDLTMVVHLSKVFGLPLTRREAGELVKTIGAQMALLAGSAWAIHFLSSALKLGTGGLSALITGSAQGALAYYTTHIVGQAAERYLAAGKSWGDGGPKVVVRDILDSVDRESVLAQARGDILARIRSPATTG